MSIYASNPAIPVARDRAAPAAKASRQAGDAGPSVATRALFLALGYVVVTGALLAGLLVQLRDEAVNASERELSAFAQLTAGHTFEVALDLEQRLKLAEVTLSIAASASSATQEAIGPMLQEVVRNGRALKDILVVDDKGRVIYQAGGRGDIGLDWSGQALFAQFQKSGTATFAFGAPLKRNGSAAPNEWVLPVAHAWRKSGGGLAGVIVGLMDPMFFDKAWTLDSEIAGLSIALAAPDGTVFMRRPLADGMMGRSLTGLQASNHPTLEAAGTLQVTDSSSRQLELEAYRRVAAYPDLLIFVSQPMDVVLSGWRRIAWIAGSSWVVASAALALLGAWLAREMKARGALERRYFALFNSIPHPVVVSDGETGRLLAFNDAAVEQYGWSPLPASAGPVAAPRLPREFDVIANARADLSHDVARLIQDQHHRNAQGAALDVELTVRLIDFNRRPAILTVVVDVTERHRAQQARRAAEEQLRQSQKMDALGQLTGGIAHDFNNVLMIIMDGVEELSERSDLAEEARKGLDRIADSSRRAEELTRQMLAFSSKQPLRPRPTNVNDLVVDTGKLLRRTLGGQIEIESILADELWAVDIEAVQLETSLVNLCLNAREAIPKGGRVLIETANVVLDRAEASDMHGAQPGEFVLVTVSDTGHGILPEHLDQIFEPFFTTKASGKGSGLGLSMVYGFVKQSNGHLAVASEVDHGTSFRIYLPRRIGAAALAGEQKTAAVTGGNERVLVVEDDALVRSSVVRQLRSLGYRVSEAADGATGLAAFETATAPYDLLLSDVIMPGALSGKALGDEVGRRWPNTGLLFMSGYTGNVLGDTSIDIQLLAKPFRKGDLAQAVERALDKRSHQANEASP